MLSSARTSILVKVDVCFTVDKADVTLTIKDADLSDLMTGKLNPQTVSTYTFTAVNCHI